MGSQSSISERWKRRFFLLSSPAPSPPPATASNVGASAGAEAVVVPHRRADWSQDRRYQALSSWGSGEQRRVGQWVKGRGK
jgi:hypothetical protein